MGGEGCTYVCMYARTRMHDECIRVSEGVCLSLYVYIVPSFACSPCRSRGAVDAIHYLSPCGVCSVSEGATEWSSERIGTCTGGLLFLTMLLGIHHRATVRIVDAFV